MSVRPAHLGAVEMSQGYAAGRLSPVEVATDKPGTATNGDTEVKRPAAAKKAPVRKPAAKKTTPPAK